MSIALSRPSTAPLSLWPGLCPYRSLNAQSTSGAVLIVRWVVAVLFSLIPVPACSVLLLHRHLSPKQPHPVP